MKTWKRLGGALAALVVLAALTVGTALAAEPGDGGIAVQLNGKPLAFSDAAPESAGGRTFIPLRAVLEAMDATVDYDNQTGSIVIHRDGAELSMTPGQNQAAVTEDGQKRTVTMDAPPYVKEGRTYVPVRFVAEAFGCNVGWDADTKTVIIVDVDALFGDTTFDLMDNFAAYCSEKESGNMAMTGELTVDASDKSGTTLPKPVSAKGTLDGVTSDKGAQMNWKLELAQLSELLGTTVPNLEGEVRVDLEQMAVYLTLPSELLGGSEGTWYSLDLGAYQAQLLGGLDMAQLTQLEDAGIREALVTVLRSLPLDDSETSYETLSLMAKLYVDMMGDQSFTRKGDAHMAQLTLEDMVNVTVTLTQKGEDIVAADIKMDASAEGMTMVMTEHAAPDKVTVNMEMNVEENGLSVKVGLDMDCVPTDKAPVTTLPAGVQATPID